MYDIATRTVNKLSGELSTAFVEAAEANAEEDKNPGEIASASNRVESKVPYADGAEDRLDEEVLESDLTDSASDFIESKVPIIDPTQADLETEASEQLESFMDVAGMAIHPQADLAAVPSDSKVSITSGYSRTEYN